MFESDRVVSLTPWVFYIVDGIVRGRYFEENDEIGLDYVIVPPEYEQ